MNLNEMLKNMPRDGRRRYHVKCRDGLEVLVETEPGAAIWPPDADGPPFTRLQFQITEGTDELIAPYLDAEGRLPYAIPEAIEGLISRHGGVTPG